MTTKVLCRFWLHQWKAFLQIGIGVSYLTWVPLGLQRLVTHFEMPTNLNGLVMGIMIPGLAIVILQLYLIWRDYQKLVRKEVQQYGRK